MSKPKAQYFDHPSEFIFGMEPEPKHTPGPWLTSRDAVPQGYVQMTVYAEADGGRVATVFRDKANAALIACAPELVDALRNCMNSIKAIDENWEQRASYQAAEDLLRKIYE